MGVGKFTLIFVFVLHPQQTHLSPPFQIENELKKPENGPCNEFLLEAFSGAVLTDPR